MSAWLWLIIAAVFILVEVTNLALYALFVAAGALAAALAAAAGGNLAIELVAFGAVTVGGVLVARRPLLAAVEGRRHRPLVSGARGLIGQVGTVVQQVHGPHQPGIVRARGEDWPALSYDDEPHEPGEVVLIVDLESTRVVVTSN